MNFRRVISRCSGIGALLSLLLLAGTSTFADDPSPQATPTPPEMNTSRPDRLNLSPEQRQKFEGIMREMHENMYNHRDLREEIDKLVEADNYDEKAVRAVIEQHHKAAEEEMLKTAKDMHQFYKSLSPDQKKQFDMMRDRMQDRREEMRPHRQHMDDRPMGSSAEKSSQDSGGKK